jgi:glutathione S-transferase
MTPKLKLSYFDFNGGRGEPARVALSMAGIAFEDDRVVFADWSARKAQTPFGSLPVLEVDGRILSQSNAINRYVGKLAGLYPEDPWQAALCDEICEAAEEYNQALGRTFGLPKEALRAAREEFTAGKLRFYLQRFESLLEARGGMWFADGRITMADLPVVDVVRHLQSGQLAHIPTDNVEQVAPGLDRHRKRVLEEPRVAAYYEKRQAR